MPMGYSCVRVCVEGVLTPILTLLCPPVLPVEVDPPPTVSAGALAIGRPVR